MILLGFFDYCRAIFEGVYFERGKKFFSLQFLFIEYCRNIPESDRIEKRKTEEATL